MATREMSRRAQVYAQRMARRLYLAELCSKGHTVLGLEDRLVEMALSSLKEAVLASGGDCQIVAEAVRIFATNYLFKIVDDGPVREELATRLSRMSLSELFPFQDGQPRPAGIVPRGS